MEARQETEKYPIRYEQEQKLSGEEKVRLEKQYIEAQDQNRVKQQRALAEQESALQMPQFHRWKGYHQETGTASFTSWLFLEQQYKDLEERCLRLEQERTQEEEAETQWVADEKVRLAQAEANRVEREKQCKQRRHQLERDKDLHREVEKHEQ